VKVQFYTLDDLANELARVDPVHAIIVRRQFLTRHYAQEFRGSGESTFIPSMEQRFVVSFPYEGNVYYLSKAFHVCSSHEYDGKAEEIQQLSEKVEASIQQHLSQWAIRPGEYEA
jgi:hypothetical protein